MGNGVHEVHARPIGVHVEQVELHEFEVGEVGVDHHLLALIRQGFERGLVGDHHGAVVERDAARRIQRVHRRRRVELGDVVDAVTVRIAGLSDRERATR
jgi:hypothetical protein